MENKWLFLKFYGDQMSILEFLTYWVSGTTIKMNIWKDLLRQTLINDLCSECWDIAHYIAQIKSCNKCILNSVGSGIKKVLSLKIVEVAQN